MNVASLYLVLSFVAAIVPFRLFPSLEKRNVLLPAYLFLGYLLLQLSISGLITLNYGAIYPYSPDPRSNQGAYEKAALLTLLCVIFFNFGFLRTDSKPLNIPKKMKVEWGKVSQLRASVFIMVLGYIAAAVLIQSEGGLSAFLANQESFRAGGSQGKGFLIYPATAGLILSTLLYINARASEPASKKRNLAILGMAVLSVLPTIVTGFRGVMLMPVATFALYWHNMVAPFNIRKAAAYGTLLLVFFTGYGIYRSIPKEVSLSDAIEISKETDASVFFGPFTRSMGLEVVAQVIKGMDEDPRIQHEAFFPAVYETATIPIPSAIWPDKPVPLNVRFGETFFLNDIRYARGTDMDSVGGISATFVGFLYWQGGFLGVIVGSYCFGWLFKKMDATFAAFRQYPSIKIIFPLFVIPFALMAESPSNYSNTCFLHVVAMVIIILGLNWVNQKKVSLK